MVQEYVTIYSVIKICKKGLYMAFLKTFKLTFDIYFFWSSQSKKPENNVNDTGYMRFNICCHNILCILLFDEEIYFW